MSNGFNKAFDTLKNKIRQNFNDSKTQFNDITSEKETNTEIDQNIKDSVPTNVINTHFKDYTTAFENVDLLATDSEGKISAIIHAWDVDLGLIPEFMIPYIRTEIRVRDGAGGVGTGSSFTFAGATLIFNKYIQVIDQTPNVSFLNLGSIFGGFTNTNEPIKQVRVLASMIVSDSNKTLFPMQVSLSVTLQNPNDFV